MEDQVCCEDCGWKGDSDDLVGTERDRDWHFYCPVCKSGKISEINQVGGRVFVRQQTHGYAGKLSAQSNGWEWKGLGLP